MKRILSKKLAIDRSLLFAMVAALSIWAGSRLLAPERQRSSELTISSTTIPNNLPPRANAQQVRPQVYWLKTDRNKLTLVAKSLPSNTFDPSSQQQVLTTAIHKLLAAQPDRDLTTTIPKATKLRSLQVRADGVHVDLSKEFRSGGGSTSIIYRIAQVIYTASSLDANAKIFIGVEGRPIDEKHPLGGEGLILPQPITRARFAADFSIAP
jgi:spore germination protein GerM